MKKYFLLFICQLSFLSAFCQATTYFKLPVYVEENAFASAAYVSAIYNVMAKKISLKNYSGNDAGITHLSAIIKSISDNDLSVYKKASVKSDTTVEEGFGFYRIFISRSKDPKLYSVAQAGNYSFYYVELEQDIPLMVFSIEKKGNVYLNHPEILDRPVATALTTAISLSYLSPKEFKPLTVKPDGNMVIAMDSIMEESGINFIMDTVHTYFNTLDINDTANFYDARYKKVLEHYRQTLALLAQKDLKGYYSMFSDESKNRIIKSFEMSKNTDEAIQYYVKFKTSYTLVSNIIDVGKIKILVVSNPAHQIVKSFFIVYMFDDGKEIKWVNENMMFYLDDLFRIRQFQDVLIQKKEQNNIK